MLQKVIKRFPPFLSPGLRPFAVFFLCTALFLGAQGAWGADYWEYTWTGAVDTNWSEIANWVAVDPETRVLQTHTNPPNAHGDTAIIPAGRANYPVIPDGQNIELFKLFDNRTPGPGSITIESGGTVTIASGASVTCGKIEIQQGGTLINNGKLNSTTYYRSGVPAVRSGEAHIQNGGTFKNSGTVTVERFSAEYASTVPKGKVTGTGTFELGGTITTGAEQTYDGAVTLAADTTLKTGTSENITFSSTLDGAFSLTVSQAQDVTFTGEIGGSVPLKNIEVTTDVSSITAGNVTLTGSWENKSNTVGTVGNMIFTEVDTSQIFGNNVFDNFTCTTPGKMLSFENDRKQTVLETFTIIGTTGTGIIQLTGFSFGTYWEIEAGTHLVKYAKVDSSHNVKASTIMTCYNGIVTSSSEWKTMSLSTYYWNGNNNSWSTPGNWRLGNASGVSAQYAPQSFDDVEIPNSLLTYPNLEADVTIASLTLADGASINGAKNLTVNGNTAIVGKIGDTTPLASFTVGGKTTIGTTANPPISISTTGNQTYRNDIEIKAPTTFTAQDITVSGAVTMQTGNLTINAVGAVIFNRDITGTTTTTTITLEKAASAVFNGRLSLATFTNQASATIVFNNSVRVTNTFTSNNADSVTSHLSFYAKIFSGSGTNTSYTFKGTTISNVFSISSTGTVTLAGILQIDGTPVASPGFTFPGPVVLASRTEINSKNGTIRFSSTINGAQGSSYALTLNAGTGDVFFNQDVGNTAPLADIAINTAKSVTAGKVTLSGSWNNNSGKEAKVGSITFTGTGTSQISGTNTFTTLASSQANKIIEFPASGTTVKAFFFNASAGSEITLRGIADAAWVFNYSGSSATLNNIKVRKSSFTSTSVSLDVILSVSSTAAVQSENNTTGNQKTGSPRWNFGNEYIWTGAVDGNWNNTGNWSMGAIPPANSDVVIPGSFTHNLSLETNTKNLASLTINDGATFEIQIDKTLNAQKTIFDGDATITDDGTLSTTIPDPITGSVTINVILKVTGEVTINATRKSVVLNNFDNEFSGFVSVTDAQDITLAGKFTQGLVQAKGTGITTLHEITLNKTGVNIKNAFVKITGDIINASVFTLEATDSTSPTIELGAIISPTSSVLFKSPVVLTKNSTIQATDTITFENILDGQFDLTVGTNTTVTFWGKVGGAKPLATLTKTGTGTTQINGGAVTTVGAQTYNGAVVFSSTNETSFDASEIKFNSTLNPDAASTNKNVKIIASTGDITFDSAVGSENDPIGRFTVTSAGKVFINNAFFQTKTDDFIVTSDNIAVGEHTFIAGNIKLDSGTRFTQTGNNFYPEEANYNEQSVQSITLSGTATMDWAVNTNIDDGGSLTITGNVINAGTATLDFGFKSIVFASAITLSNLTLLDMTIASTGHVTLNGPITVRRNITIEDGGSYSPDVHTLTLGGTGTVNGTIKDENDGKTNPKQNFGEIKIEQNNTTKTFATDITAGTITCNASSGAITFDQKLTSTTKITFGNGSAPVTFKGEVSAVNIDLGSGSGAITFGDNLTAETLTNNTGGAFDLVFNGNSTIKTDTQSATINTTGTITFKKINTFSGGLSIDNAPVNLGGSLAISQGNIIFPAPVTLLTATSFITISTGNGTITFNSTIDGTNDSQETLHLLPAGTGGVNFGGAVGGTKALKALTIRSDGPVTQTAAGIITANELSLEHSGLYTLEQNNQINKLRILSRTPPVSPPDDAVTFKNGKDLEVTGITRGNDVSVTLTAGNLTFTNPVKVTGTATLTVDAGTVNFNDNFTATNLIFDGTDPATNLVINGKPGNQTIAISVPSTSFNNVSGTITIGNHREDSTTFTNGFSQIANGGSVSPGAVTLWGTLKATKPSEPISFTGEVTLKTDTTVNTTDGNIAFGSTVDGAHDLTLDAGTSGTITFGGAVGGGTELAKLETTGTNIEINGGTVTTKGSQIYTGAVTIGADTTLTTNENGNINFNSTVNGTTANMETLTVNAGTGNVIFGDAVGGITPLDTVTISSALTAASGAGIQFNGDFSASDLSIGTVNSKPNVYITNKSVFKVGADNTGVIEFPANLFIAAGNGKDVSFNKDVTVANSIALFSGDVSLGGNLTATNGDIVLLKGDSQTMFKSGTLEGLFGYNAQNMTQKYAAARGSLTSQVSIPVFPSTSPNNDPIDHTNYYGTVITSALAGKTLSAGKNFYANGVNLTATAWTLSIPDNAKATDSFAEMYNLEVTNCTVTNNTSGGTWAWVSAAELTGAQITASTGNTNIAFSRPQFLVNDNTKATGASLSGTYTIYDDVIRVEFVDSITGSAIKIENTNNEIWEAIENIKFNGTNTTGIAFFGAYEDPECKKTTTRGGINSSDPPIDLSVFYLKTNGTIDQRWNTDATGANEGTADSTDRGRDGQPPEHRIIIPSIDIPAALTDFYQTLRDEHKNRIATVSFTQTADRCRPVVVEVRTGQEVHKPFAAQEKYDAHNFIEIRYSEPVTIPQFSVPDITEYVKSQNAFNSAAAGGAITQNGAGFDISGFANLETGTLETGTNGVNDPTVHALYRNFTFDGTESVNPADSAQNHRVRISIAGWTDTKGATGYEYPGYIDNAVTPSGAVTVFKNRNITDNSSAYKNAVEPTVNDDPAYGSQSFPKAAITVNETVTPAPVQDLYGSWDVAPPVVSRFDWYDEKNGYEIVGNSNAAGYVGNFEFHFFDNTPDYPKTPPRGTTWLYSRGWGDLSNPIRPDTVGGSRPEYVQTPTSPKTQGGLRSATITADIVKNAFLLYLAEQKSNIGFDGTFERFITLNNFFGDETQPLSVTDDTLYLSLKPARTDLRSRETYDVVYDSSKGFITDLAGNRLKSAIWRTIDRTPPKISMTVTPYDDTRLFVFFNKKIELDPLPAAQNAVLSNIHQEFLFFNKSVNADPDPDSDLSPNLAISDLRATKAELVFHTEDATGLILTLSRKVNYTELSTAFISLKKHTDLQDITGPVPAASNITDKKYNWMNWNDRIPVTYFGVNTIKPLYATDGMVQTGGDKKEGTTVVIRGDFDGSGQLYYDREISMQVRLADGVMPQTVPDVFIDAKPNPDSVSVTFNKNSGKNLSFWLPNLPDFPYQLISPSMNTHAVKLATGTGSGQVYTFKIPVNSPEREPGDTLQFIFRHGEIMTPDRVTGQLTVPTPFYHIRLNNAQDPSELSLFAFNVLSMLRQRGGSTILNNVIQAGSEEAVLEVIMPKQGNLTVSVMTLDGNVIKHLHHGTASAGTHYLRWNGTNASGRSVARGMYFVRIIGPNIDETRKIMVVKD